jgi:hypothetical protein
MNYFCKVKFLTSLLTIYILLLSMFPCPEDVFASGKETSTLVAEHPSDSSETDDCPPYCSCACCGVQMLRSCNCLQLKTPIQFAVQHPGIADLHLSDILLPIWQPPKLS